MCRLRGLRPWKEYNSCWSKVFAICIEIASAKEREATRDLNQMEES